jgi:predicted membrane-bound spermidine synthase
MLALLYGVFILSGAAGLIYESIWSRYLALFVGHGAYAQILVMTIFLGGMAVGALIAGRFSLRFRRPLAWYALAELLVGLLGLVFHPVFVATSRLAYDSIFPGLAGSPVVLVLVKWGLAAVLILPQSILLGTTFPLMSAGILRWRFGNAGRVLAWLYASNSFGAAAGVLVAGFYLVRRFDYPGTLLVAAALNLVVALVTTGLALGRRAAVPDGRAPPSTEGAAIEGPLAVPRTLLFAVAFGTAAASLGYEIAWLRMLALVLGSATHSFELMLSAFILGLALGALWVRRRADHFRDPVRALGIVQCLMGALAVATLPLYVASFSWTVRLLAAFAKTAEGYTGYTIARYAICLGVMVPATFCAGITLPLITRTLYRSGADERVIGEVYAMNTAGSIVGVQLAGLVLLPLLGLKLLLISAAGLDAILGLALLYAVARRAGRSRWPVALAAAGTTLVFVAGAATAHFDRTMLGSGVFRDAALPARGEYSTTFYRDGRTATVTVRRSPLGDVTLATNGKPDASVRASWLLTDTTRIRRGPLRDDECTQVLLALIALAHAPQARTAAVIGQGSGMTSHLLLGSPTLGEVVTIEIEPEMIHGSMAFFPLNRRTFEDPRAHFVIDDAKSYFAAAGQRFDLIVSEPSNPWVSGVAGLFTTEFYRQVKRYLAPNGVFGQWLHLYELNDALVRSVLAALQASFPQYAVFMVGESDIEVIAVNGSTLPVPDWGVARLPMIARDLHRVLPLTPDALEALRVADSRALSPFVATATPNSDFAPLLDLGAEQARYLRTQAEGLGLLNVFSFDVGSALSDRRLAFATAPRAPAEIPRLEVRARSALLRGVPSAPGQPADPQLGAALARRRIFDGVLQTGEAPPEWREWVALLLEIDRDIHGGSPGVVDSGLYRPLDGYLRASGAPAGVRRAVEFFRALDAWDFRAASAASDALLNDMRHGQSWVSPDYLRDGAVMAKLKTGDPAGAKRFFDLLLPQVRRDVGGVFRSRLLAANIARALHPEVRPATKP